MDDAGTITRPAERTFASNRVVRHTGAKYPIIQAPMSWIARAPLASAVSAAGGLGLLENSSKNLAIIQREVAATKAATDQPYGFNLPVKFMKVAEEDEKAILDWVIAQQPRFVTTSA